MEKTMSHFKPQNWLIKEVKDQTHQLGKKKKRKPRFPLIQDLEPLPPTASEANRNCHAFIRGLHSEKTSQ